MLNKISKSNKGFTIIEVVLVLAIAAIIMGLVFVAVPAFQAQGRDTARRSDANNILAALSRYQTNNNNTNPTAFANIGSGYNAFTTTTLVTCTAATCTAITAGPGTVTVTLGSTCNSAGSTNAANATPTKSAVVTQATVIAAMDNGQYYCVNN